MTIAITLRSAALPEQPTAIVERHAVKAVITDGRQRLLLLRSRYGDHKFPGGGIEPGESQHAALARELAEECGLRRVRVHEPVVTVVESRSARERGAVFRMVSTYFRVSTDAPVRQRAERLDGYERDLELTPCRVTVDEAIAANRRVAAGMSPDRARALLPWLERETEVLIRLSAVD